METLLPEQLSEKTTTEIQIVEITNIPDFEYFIKIKDFEKTILAYMLIGVLVTLGAVFI